MRTNPLLHRGIAVVVIALLVALAFAPSINANVSKEDELVEVTTEFCGLPGQKPQTVQLTPKQTEEVDRLFEDIKTQLDNAETREETIRIFHKAVVELDKYELLGGLSVKQAQRLVTGWYQKDRLNSLPLDEYENRLCLISGRTSWTKIFRNILYYLAVLYSIINENELFGLSVICAIIAVTQAIPIDFFKLICFGEFRWQSTYEEGSYRLSEGWIWSLGTKGVQKFDGSFYGNLPLPPCPMGVPGSMWAHWYPGAVGFTGIHISINNGAFYIGSALRLKIGEEPPDV